MAGSIRAIVFSVTKKTLNPEFMAINGFPDVITVKNVISSKMVRG
jgi:hypothetical protein